MSRVFKVVSNQLVRYIKYIKVAAIYQQTTSDLRVTRSINNNNSVEKMNKIYVVVLIVALSVAALAKPAGEKVSTVRNVNENDGSGNYEFM